MATLKDSFDTGDDTQVSETSDAEWQAQTFTASSSYSIGSVTLKLWRSGNPGTLTVSIRATTGGATAVPTGSDLASGTLDVSAVPTTAGSAAWSTITFSAATALVSGTIYAIIIRVSGAGFLYLRDDTGSGYSSGRRGYSTNSGSTWINGNFSSTDDLLFRTYDQDAAPPATSQYVTKKLIAVGTNEVWYESTAGTPIQLAASVGQLDTTLPVQIFELYGKVFIVNKTNKKVVDFANVKIATTSVGTHPPDFRTVLTGGTSGAKMVVDYITALSSACTIYGKRITTATFVSGETVTGTDDDGNAISFVISANEVAGPHWYNWTTFGASATFGSLPDKAILGCNWRGRAVVSGNENYPHQWYMTRQGNPWDRNWIANDAGAPVEGGNAEAGEIGDVVLSLIPFSRDYLIFGCANSIWFLSGDPAEGGSLLPLDDTAGILGADTWCKDKDENVFILSTVGLLQIPKGFGGKINLTQENYPDFIKDLAYDPTVHKIILAYDRKRNGIHIFRTTLVTGANSCWWYDLHENSRGLFPESYPTVCGVFSVFYYEATDPDYQGLLFGCNDGYIRLAEDTDKDDDSGGSDTAINSYVTFGPIPVTDGNDEGKIDSLVGVMTGGRASGSVIDSNNVSFSLWTGLSSDEIVEKLTANTTPNIAGTFSAPGRGRGAKKRKSVRGAFFGLRIGNSTAAQTWGLEKITIDAHKVGRVK